MMGGRVSEISFIKTEETFWFKQRFERFINDTYKNNIKECTKESLNPEKQENKQGITNDRIKRKFKR
jgi:methionine salvage enolase-phosphatase E1